MTNLQRCEFFLLRYVPDLLKNEFVNFGVVMLDAERKPGPAGFAEVRFTRDWRRVKCMAADADLEMLQALEEDLRRRLALSHDREDALRTIEQFSNTIQLSDSQVFESASPQVDVERLAFEYLESPKEKAERSGAARGRMAVYQPMREEFVKAGVWPLMNKAIAAALYTHPGDPLKIDCGYRPDGTVKMFHAFWLKGEVDSAKAFAYSCPKIIEGIARVEKAEARLTAVVEDNLDRKSDSVQFALDAFEQARIAVATLSQVSQLAEIARKELRV